MGSQYYSMESPTNISGVTSFYYFQARQPQILPSSSPLQQQPLILTGLGHIDRTPALISQVVSFPLIIITFLAALLGSFVSWLMSFFFLERFPEWWDKIIIQDIELPSSGGDENKGKDFDPNNCKKSSRYKDLCYRRL